MHGVIKALVVASLLAAGFAVHHHHDWFFGTQDEKKQDAKKQDAGGMPPPPQPTDEHKWLAEGAGKWKAVGKIHTGPDQTVPMEGIQTNTMQQGGLWQIIDYKENSGGFAGHGVSGYDTEKKKFVSVWVDSMTTQASIGEGTLSPDKKSLGLLFDMPGPDGKMMKVQETITRKDDKTTTLDMSSVGADGKLTKMLEITYTKM
jgi:Protein of unknown function (DUF1579)